MIGHVTWAIPESHILRLSVNDSRDLHSHEAACVLTGD